MIYFFKKRERKMSNRINLQHGMRNKKQKKKTVSLSELIMIKLPLVCISKFP